MTMAPSPNPSQTSLEKIKFSPIPTTTEEEEPQQPQPPTTTTTTNHNHHNQQPDIIPNPDDDGFKVTIMEADDDTAACRASPLTVTSQVHMTPVSRTRAVFLKVLFYVIVAVVILVLISSVAITINNIRNTEDNSSDSVSGANDTFVMTTEASSSSSSSSSVAISTTASTPSSTFLTPECLPTQFRCPSGQCLPQTARCNKLYECPDQADEANCTNCDTFECVVTKVCLWAGKARCDEVLDCPDLSDEIGCSINPRRHRLCKNGVRIPRLSWCDGLDDCMDNSDEKRCECRQNEVPCEGSRGRCVPKSSLCDGYRDCENGSDEDGCDVCTQQEFQCDDSSCIPGKGRCDGHIDCPGGGGEDETGCVQIHPDTNQVQILSNNSWIPVCSTQWTTDHSAAMCQGNRHVQEWSDQPMSSSHYYAVVKAGSGQVTPGDFDVSTTCETGKVVTLKCRKQMCGESKMSSLTNTIAGGELSPLGKWPWMASLHHRHSPICGAVIIDQSWALTALHCVTRFYPDNSTSTPTLTLHLATTNSSTNQNQHIRHVTGYHPHPLAKVLHHGGVNHDLALLRLDSPVQYSDLVQPICLPGHDRVYPPTSVCFLAGWGLLSEWMVLKPSKLRDTRLRVWSESQCQANVETGETSVDTNATICAGYYYGLPSGCQGDSGGPLMCLDKPHHPSRPFEYRWSLAGIMSSSQSICGKVQPGAMANRFARVATSVRWIHDVIGTRQDEDSIPQLPNPV